MSDEKDGCTGEFVIIETEWCKAHGQLAYRCELSRLRGENEAWKTVADGNAYKLAEAQKDFSRRLAIAQASFDKVHKDSMNRADTAENLLAQRTKQHLADYETWNGEEARYKATKMLDDRAISSLEASCLEWRERYEVKCKSYAMAGADVASLAGRVRELEGALKRVMDCLAERKLEICIDCIEQSSAALTPPADAAPKPCGMCAAGPTNHCLGRMEKCGCKCGEAGFGESGL